MASAVALSIALLQTSTPPKALSGSPASAASQASFTVGLHAMPQGLVCLIIANTASPLGRFEVVSAISCTAASTSTKLL